MENKAHIKRLTPQPIRTNTPSYIRKVKDSFVLFDADSGQPARLTELNKAANELKMIFQNIKVKNAPTTAVRKSVRVGKLVNRSSRQIAKAYGLEVRRQSERATANKRLPSIKKESNLDAMQKFYSEFHHKSKELLKQLQKSCISKL